MNVFRRVLRGATVVWALYLTIALTAFALHSHAPDEDGSPRCALCLAQHVTSATTVVAAFVLAAPVARWEWQEWRPQPELPVVCARPELYFSRGPPSI